MATFDYARAQASVRRLLDRFGQIGTIKHSGVDTACRIAPVDYSFERLAALAATGARQVYVEALAFEPVPNVDLLFIGGLAYKIVPPVRKLDPDGTVVFYELQVKR